MVCNFRTFLKLIFWLAGVPSLAGILLYASTQWSFQIGQWGFGIYFLFIWVIYEILVILKLKDEIEEC